MIYRILAEGADGFAPTGDTFDGSAEELIALLDELREKTGVCHSAELVKEDKNNG